jgi:signal transduction histidine kinase
MAGEFRLLGVPLPAELDAADRAWYGNRDRQFPQPAAFASARPPEQGDGGSEDQEQRESDGEEFFDADLAAIFVLPLNAQGAISYDPNPYALPMAPDLAAAAAAQANGSDWRTVKLADGTRVRLLSYRVGGSNEAAVLQLGRALGEQDRVLTQLQRGLLVLGGICALGLAAGSWWLAGRSLVPTQRAWEQQQAFVANASHELRTPLTLLRASAEVALRGLPPEDGDRRELLGDVLQECDHMSRLVEDLLLLSRLDSGRLTLERKPVDLPDLFSDVERQVGRLAAERQVGLHVAAQNGDVAYADPTRLRQIVLILLDNALRHTPPGGLVQLDALRQGRQVTITVADNGRGIAPEHQEHVFERFYRGNSSPPAKGENGGSGLGLAIAKGLVIAMHGQISLDSQPGQGTRMSLTLPAEAAQAPFAQER